MHTSEIIPLNSGTRLELLLFRNSVFRRSLQNAALRLDMQNSIRVLHVNKGVFILKATYHSSVLQSLNRWITQRSALMRSFQLLYVLRVETVGFFSLSVFLFLCAFFFFLLSGSQRAPLDPPCSHGNTGRHWQDGCASDAGPDGSQWGERSGNGISGSAAGPFTGGGEKTTPPARVVVTFYFQLLGWFTTGLGWWMKPRSVLLWIPLCALCKQKDEGIICHHAASTQ